MEGTAGFSWALPPGLSRGLPGSWKWKGPLDLAKIVRIDPQIAVFRVDLEGPPGPSPEPPGSRPWRGPLGLEQTVRIEPPNRKFQHAF